MKGHMRKLFVKRHYSLVIRINFIAINPSLMRWSTPGYCSDHGEIQ